MADEAVVNGPAGGPQDVASTNDANGNDVLRAAPWVVVANDGTAIGVVERFSDEGDAKANADARTKVLRDSGNGRTIFEVVKENDVDNGLPAMLQNVETAEAQPAAAAAQPKSSDS